MGLIVPVVVHTTLEAAPATFTNLVARFLPHMTDWYATLDEMGTAERNRALPAEMITNDLSALVSYQFAAKPARKPRRLRSARSNEPDVYTRSYPMCRHSCSSWFVWSLQFGSQIGIRCGTRHSFLQNPAFPARFYEKDRKRTMLPALCKRQF